MLKATYVSGWVTEDTGVQSFAPGTLQGTSYLFDLTSSDVLKATYGSGWVTEDTGVRAFALGSLNGVDGLVDLTYSDVLKASIGLGWLVVDTDAIGDSLRPDGLVVDIPNGGYILEQF